MEHCSVFFFLVCSFRGILEILAILQKKWFPNKTSKSYIGQKPLTILGTLKEHQKQVQHGTMKTSHSGALFLLYI